MDKLELLSEESFLGAAECLKVVAHPVRLKMIQTLLQMELSVGDLAELCEIKKHVASEHLRLMQRCHLLKSKKEGRSVYYYVSEPLLQQLMGCIEKKFG